MKRAKRRLKGVDRIPLVRSDNFLRIFTSLPAEMSFKIFRLLRMKSLKRLMSLCPEISAMIVRNYPLWFEIYMKEVGCREISDFSLFALQHRVKMRVLARFHVFSSRYSFKDDKILDQPDITQIILRDNVVFTASDDKIVRIYFDGGEFQLRGHIGGVWAFDVTSRYVVTSSTDKTVRIWDRSTSECLYVLRGHRSTIRCLRATESFVISGGRDSLVKVWGYDGILHRTLSGHILSVRALDVCNDFVVSGSYDGSVVLWNYVAGVRVAELEKHVSRVYSVAINERYVVSGAQDSNIHVSDHSGNLLCTLKGHRSIVAWLRFYVEGSQVFLFSSGADGSINKWCLRTFVRLFTIRENHHITGMKVCNGVLIVAKNHGVDLYSARSGAYQTSIIRNVDSVFDIDISVDSIVVGYEVKKKCKLLTIKYKAVDG